MTVTLLARFGESAAVAKPSGLLVHNSDWAGPPEPTLTDAARTLLGECDPLHRLDRGTSGVVWFCLDRSRYAAHHAALQAPTAVKRYLALVRGHLRERVELDHPVPDGEGGRLGARSLVTPLAISPVERVSLVEVRLFTGRRHQVRLHLKHLSHPVIGDANYGKGAINRDLAARYGLSRLALHCVEASYEPPVGGRATALAPVDPSLAEPLDRLVPGWRAAVG